MALTSRCFSSFKKTFRMATLRHAPLPFCFPNVVSMILMHGLERRWQQIGDLSKQIFDMTFLVMEWLTIQNFMS